MSKAKTGNHQQSTAPIIASLMVGDRVRFPTGRKAIYKGGDKIGTPTEEHEFEFIGGGMIALRKPNLWIAQND